MKKNFFQGLFGVFGVLVLAACAGPVTMSPQGSGLEIQQETLREKELAFKQLIRDQDRVFNIAFPILAGNADFCRDAVVPSIGMTFWNLESEKPEYHQAAASLYNLHAQLAVQHVADKSPADRAGIRSGDLVVAINGQGIPHGRTARKTAYEAVVQAEYSPIDILIERRGKLINTVVQPVRSCAYPVVLNYDDTEVNAYADGSHIFVAKGILRFAENDHELALVIAHELGHNAMGHIDKQRSNAMVGGIGGLAIDALLASAGVNSGNEFGRMGQELGAQSYSVEFEQEADYVGMYFMERAGYNSSGVADFWRRFAIESPKSVSARVDHPTSPERFIAIGRTHSEISRKKASGQKLVPNFKPE